MRFKTIGQILILFLLGACLLLAGLYIGLPNIIEFQIKKRLPQTAIFKDIDFKIENVSGNHASISEININSGIVIDHVDIYYNFKELQQIQISKIVVSGVQLRAFLDDTNKIQIQGLPQLEPRQSSQNRSKQPFFSYLPDKVVVKNSRVVIDATSDQSNPFYLPFDGLAIIDKPDETIKFLSRAYPFGEKIKIEAAYGLKAGLKKVQITARSFDLGHLNALIEDRLSGTRLAGQCDFDIYSTSPEERWSASLSYVGFQSGFDFDVKDMTCEFKVADTMLSLNGLFSVSHKDLLHQTFTYELLLDRKDAHLYKLKLANNKTDKLTLPYKSGRLELHHPKILVNMTANTRKGRGSMVLETGKAEFVTKEATVGVNRASINAAVSFDHTPKGLIFNTRPQVRITRLTGNSSGDSIVFPTVRASGNIFYDIHKGPVADMQIEASAGRLDFKSQKITATGITATLPVQFPRVKKQKKGTYRITQLLWNNQYPVSAQGNIRQTGFKKVVIDGRIIPGFLTKASPRYAGTFYLDKTINAVLDYSIPPFELNGTDIKKIVPEFNLDADMAMTVSASGKAGLSNHQLDTRMTLDIKEGRFDMPELKMTAKGINSRIIFNDLLTPETEPGQMMTIDHINIDKIDVDDAKLRFSIEDAKYILLENFKFKWCKGLVSTEAIRFPNKEKSYSLILYCDRLDLAELLKQMGVFNAEGSGSLNGRIPIVYNDGEISFDNGFLFSTPGSGGKVNIINTDKLIQGIPIDSPQFAELDLAREALKDFEYKWAKLTLNTLEDILFVNMEMDGKPANVLPFEYRRDLGRFARVDASHPGSRFQGIDLDVNLNLPFNDVMKFGNKLKSLFNQ